MNNDDRLFFFIDGLQPWARNEFQRQQVQDLPSALTAAERLSDYAIDGPQPKRSLPMSGGNGNWNKKPKNWCPNKGRGAARAELPKETNILQQWENREETVFMLAMQWPS